MKFSRQINFSVKLIKAHFLQYSLSIFGIFIGTATIFFFFSLTQGLKNGISQNFITERNILTVQAPPQKISFFQKKLTDDIKKKLENIQGVEKIYTEVSLMIPSTIALPIPVFGDMMLDAYFIRGIDDELFSDPEFLTHTASKDSIPVLISPLAVDFLNSFANSIPGFPGISKNNLEGKQFSVEFGKSVFLPIMNKEISQNSQLFVSGFSPIAPLLGIMIPESESRKLAQVFEIDVTDYSRLHLKISDSKDTTLISNQITDMGFIVRSEKEGSEKISQALTLLQIVFLFSAALVLLISILFLFSLLTISVLEHTKTIGILRSLGAGKKVIRNIFLFQGMIISLLGSSLGILFGGAAIYYADIIAKNNIPITSFLPESLFDTSPSLVLGLFFGISITAFFATVFPAERAARKDPLALLLE